MITSALELSYVLRNKDSYFAVWLVLEKNHNHSEGPRTQRVLVHDAPNRDGGRRLRGWHRSAKTDDLPSRGSRGRTCHFGPLGVGPYRCPRGSSSSCKGLPILGLSIHEYIRMSSGRSFDQMLGGVMVISWITSSCVF